MIRDIALAHGDDPRLRTRLRLYQLRALDAIATCGTPAAGLHEEVCDHCGDRRRVPNTCGNRSCPHCQGRERAEWVAAREAELLPCGYFHAVLTLPPELRGLAEAFPTTVLGALMRSAGDAIDHLCRDPRHLGAEVGQLAVLHTWRRDLGWHPHVHLIITAGGWDDHRQRWVDARSYGRQRKAFLLPVDRLRAAFQHRLRRSLLNAYRHGDFVDGPHEAFPCLATGTAFRRHLDHVCQRPWVIRIEPPFGGARQLVKYLGAYVNRVAIGPKRILDHDETAGTVTYTWTTNADPDKDQVATVDAVDFLQRFARHILPPRFHRIRFRGLWSTAHRRTKLHRVQRALGVMQPSTPTAVPEKSQTNSDNDPYRCTACGQGRYQRLPGPNPRPRPRERRRLLDQIRRERRTATPQGSTSAA